VAIIVNDQPYHDQRHRRVPSVEADWSSGAAEGAQRLPVTNAGVDRRGDRMWQVRAGDTDRQVVVDRLGIALREGRLDLAEYDERLRQAYAARTYRELDGLLADLPAPPTAEDLASWRVWWACCLRVPYREARAPERGPA
jgi:hypothetical protein